MVNSYISQLCIISPPFRADVWGVVHGLIIHSILSCHYLTSWHLGCTAVGPSAMTSRSDSNCHVALATIQ